MSESAWAVRLWRVRPWNPSPLMRVSDRFEIVLRALAVVVVIVAVPVAGAFGTVSYTNAADRIAVEDVGKTEISATVTGEPRLLVDPGRSGVHQDRYEAAVEWNHDGRSGTATVEIPGPQEVGSTVALWVGADGEPATEPAKPGAAAAEGIGTGLAILVESWCAAAASVWITGAVLDARRNARWDREWRELNDRTIGKDSL
ncbi:hypothetical protein [Nocardia sp. NPDC127526]|uniref:Rv1733c family protein n=1 Tax=Nocardia sp. NPDC127526 TaxID=3345393 RepID=UPI0036312FB8